MDETGEARLDCGLCGMIDGRSELPGGVIHQTDVWVVMHVLGSFGPGALAVLPRRHRLHLSDLDVNETAELGQVLRDTVAVVEGLTSPARVYSCMWSHTNGEPAHIHFVVQPIRHADMEGHPGELGPMLQSSLMSDPRSKPPAEDVVVMADRARGLWPRRQ